jgi:hypothetical protein
MVARLVEKLSASMGPQGYYCIYKSLALAHILSHVIRVYTLVMVLL